MKIWNSLTGQKEEFQPQSDPVRMYVCGVTPYDESHIGHAMSYIVFDVIRRYLEFRGYRLKCVQNFTDIDDKIIARAQRLNISADDLAQQYIDSYFADMDRLNVRRADVYPRVTEEIPAIIDLIGRLEERGFAYPSDGDVYFRVQRFAEYGKLSHRTLEGMMAGARIEIAESKEHPMDFVLWKGAKPGEPQWDSPWGPGRPGWHIECSAMSMKYLGDSLDLHGGGQDLVFPHHENEIAQSEAGTGVAPFSRYWLHNGLLRMGEEKMSKSLGNLVTIQDAVERYGVDALRIFVLNSHYRSPLTYSEEALEAAAKGADRLREAVRESPTGVTGPLDPAAFGQRFTEAMDDDFNSAQAIATLFDLAREINRGREAGADVRPAQRLMTELGSVLGLSLSDSEGDSLEAAPYIDLLVELRAELRGQKNFQLADRIRNQLTELGITLEDSAAGTTWKATRR